LKNPFSTTSPYEELEIARRRRLVRVVLTIAAQFCVPLVVVTAFVLIPQPSAWAHFAFGLLVGIAPIALISRRVSIQGHPDLGSYFFLAYMALLLGINTLILEGLHPIFIVSLLLLALLAGMMLPPRRVYIVTAGLALEYIVVRVLLIGHAFPATLPFPLMEITVAFLGVMAIIFVTFMNTATMRDLRRALDDATYDLVLANEKIQQASDRKSQITARTSHELRTPLSAIIVFADLALREAYGPLNEKMANAMQHILNSSRHLKTVINDLLDLSKIEAGELEVENEPFELAEVVRVARSTCMPMAESKGLTCRISVAPDMPAWLNGDCERLAQVIVNLTANAIKFTEQGEVDVRIAPDGHHTWTIRVRDTGIGIPREHFDAVFEAYRQLDKRQGPSVAKGTGLGLAITRNLVELMGGVICLDSELGVGSTFEVQLPLAVVEPQEAPPEAITG